MVARMSYGKSLYGVLSYNLEKVDKEKAKILSAQGIITNDKEGNPDLHLMIKSFETYLINNQNTRKPILHISLNPHPKDHLTNDQLEQIGKEYLQKLGYGNQPFIIFKHEDISRHHIHIVTLRTDQHGKKINDSFEYRRSEKATIELENKYGLHPAQQNNNENIYDEIKKIDIKKGDVKKQLSSMVKNLASRYNFTSLNEFKTLLGQYNITFDEIKGQFNNKPYWGIVYYVMGKNGEKISRPFKSSLFGKKACSKDLLKKIEESKKKLKNNSSIKQTLCENIKKALSDCRQKKKTFQRLLKKQNIDVIFRQNDEGRIYGITFIDHNNNVVLNGSRLGKEYSANSFEKIFSEQETENKNVIIKNTPNPATDFNPGIFSLGLSNLLRLPTDQEEDQYQPLVPKKKKRRKKID